MANIAMLLVCLFAGMGLRVSGRMPDNAHAGLNGFIIHLALPGLILDHLHGVTLTSDMIGPVAMPWLMFVISIAAFCVLSRVLRMPPATTGGLILTAGLANTSFVGLPMIEAFYGPGGLSTGIMIDQLGSYLVLGTLGVVVACVCSQANASPRAMAVKIVTFPPLIAVVLTLATATMTYPDWFATVARRLGETVAPLALVSVGLQLRLNQADALRLPLGAGLGFKLILAPLALTIIYVQVLHQGGETTRITLFESAMGPMIGGSVVAIQYGLNPLLVTLMVGCGIVMSFVTLPIWWLILGSI